MGQSAEAVEAFVNDVGTHLVDIFIVGHKDMYAGSMYSCLYTLVHVSGVKATGVETQVPTLHTGADGGTAAANPTMPALSKPSTSPIKVFRDRFKKARR